MRKLRPERRCKAPCQGWTTGSQQLQPTSYSGHSPKRSRRAAPSSTERAVQSHSRTLPVGVQGQRRSSNSLNQEFGVQMRKRALLETPFPAPQACKQTGDSGWDRAPASLWAPHRAPCHSHCTQPVRYFYDLGLGSCSVEK